MTLSQYLLWSIIIKMINLSTSSYSQGSEWETPLCGVYGVRSHQRHFSHPCSHNDILRSASKWLISPWGPPTLLILQSSAACAKVSSGDGEFFWPTERHCCFTPRLFSSEDGKVIRSAGCRCTTKPVLIVNTALSDPVGNSSVYIILEVW